MCGEGGEYESLVLDSPLYKKKIVIDDVKVVTHSSSTICPVMYLVVQKYHLEDKVAGYDPLSFIAELEKIYPLMNTK